MRKAAGGLRRGDLTDAACQSLIARCSKCPPKKCLKPLLGLVGNSKSGIMVVISPGRCPRIVVQAASVAADLGAKPQFHLRKLDAVSNALFRGSLR